MPCTWYVTFEVPQRGSLPRRRSPRATRTFETESEAKNFAREQFNLGLTVFAGTINPHTPRQLIPSSRIPLWLECGQEQDIVSSNDTQAAEKQKGPRDPKL